MCEGLTRCFCRAFYIPRCKRVVSAVFSSSSLQLDTTNDDFLVLQDDIVVQDASRGELYGRKGLYYELKADQNDTIRSIKDSKGKNKENATDMVIAYLSLHT